MKHIDFESFMDEESSFLNEHLVSKVDGQLILSFADELKMLNDSNSEDDVSCIPSADETILEISKNSLLMEISQLQKNEEKYKAEILNLAEKVKLLQSDLFSLQTSNNSALTDIERVDNDISSPLPQKLLNDNKSVNVDSVKLLSENQKFKFVIANVESELESLNFENKKSVKIIENYEFENKKLKLIEQELNSQLKKAENKIMEFNCHYEELQDKVLSLQQANNIPCKLCESLQSEHFKGSEPMLDSGKLEVQNEKPKLMSENTGSVSIIKNNDNIVIIKYLEHNIEILKESEKDIKVELQRAKASVDELSIQNQKLLEQIQTTLLENDRLCNLHEATKIELQGKIDECKALDKELDKTVNEYKNSHSFVQSKFSTYKSQIQQLEKEKSNLNETLSSFSSSTSLTYQKQGGMVTPNRDIISISKDDSNDVLEEDLKRRICDLEKENLSLVNKLSENNRLISLGDKAEDDSEWKSQCEILLQKNKELKEMLEITQKELATKAEECKALDRELDATIYEYKDAQSYVTEINNGLKNKVQELEKDKSRLSETLACQSNHTVIDCSNQQIKNTTAVDPYQDLLFVEKQHLEKEFNVLKCENEKLITEVDTLRSSVSAKLKEIATLHSHITKLESELEAFQGSSNGVDFKEVQRLLRLYSRFEGMDECKLEEMHQHYLKASASSKCKEEKYDATDKDLKERYFEIERENNVLKMKMDAVKEAKKLKECLESEAMKNKNLMRELRPLQNMKDISICEPSAPKKIENKTIPKRNLDDDYASLSCGSQIILDVQVMRLKNENYNLEKEKSSLQRDNKLLNEHLEHYKLKGREWKTKCYKESMALKKLEVESKILADKLNAVYMAQSKCPSQLNDEKTKDPNPSVQATRHLLQSMQSPLQQISTNNTSEKFVSSVTTEFEKDEWREVEKENHGRVSASSSKMSSLAKEKDCKTQ